MRKFLLMLLLCPLASGTTYFVSNAGSDAATGTSSGASWKTIVKVNAFSFSSGDTIQFNRGDTWNEQTDAALTPASNTTVTVYGTGALPIFDGHSAIANGVNATSKSGVVIDSLQLQNYTSYAVLFSACSGCSVTNSILSNAATHGVNVAGVSPSCTLSGNTYSTSAAFDMTGKAFNVATTSGTCTMDSNTIDLSNVLSTRNVSAIVCSASTTACIATNNTIIMAQGTQGIGIKSSSASGNVTGGQIIGNRITGLTSSCTGCDGEGIELTGDVTNQVTGALVRGNFISLGSAAVDCIGLFHAVSNVVSYNFCVGNSGTNAGIHPSSNSDTNLFYGNDLYLPSATYGFEVTGTSINNDFKNNIVVGSGYGFIFSSGGTGTFSYNNAFTNATANFSGGTNSGNNLTSDPKWASSTPTSPNDFKLQSTSPAINAGSNLGATYQMMNDSNDTVFPYALANQNNFGSWERGAFQYISCSQSDVQAEVTAVLSGDTVLVPAGSCSWSSAVVVPNTKGILLQGGNGGTTTIAQGSSSGYVEVDQNASVTTRVTGFTFTGSGSSNNGDVTIIGDSSSAPARIDHNIFTNTSSGVTFIVTSGNAPVLIDHNTLTGGAASEMIHNLGLGASDASGWTDDVTPGSSGMVFIEDNTFTFAATSAFFGTSAVQSYYGARTVLRHNTLNNAQIDQHGTPGNIGARWWEVYSNVFCTYPGVNQSNYGDLRAGSGVFYDNTVPTSAPCGANSGGGFVTLHEEDSGYPALYQVGRGISQNLSPAYLWNNASGITVNSGSGNVLQNRDYFVSGSQPNSMKRWQLSTDSAPTVYSYSPYIYPHPLQGTVVQVSPASQVFGNMTVSNSTPAIVFTLTNTGSSTLNITSPFGALTGTDASQFSISARTCNATLAAAASCTVSVIFNPTTAGDKVAALSFVDDAPGSPHTIALTGTGVVEVDLSPSKGDFAAQQTSTTSASDDFTVTNNQGTATLNITSPYGSLTGTNANQFSITARTCSATLAPGASCTVSVAFAPTSVGAKVATLTITDDASTVTQTAPLTGTGAAPSTTATPVITNIAVANITTTTADISWDTSTASDSLVFFGRDDLFGMDMGFSDPSGVTHHVVTLTGLWPSTPYSFGVLSRGLTAGAADPAKFANLVNPLLTSFTTFTASPSGTVDINAEIRGPHHVVQGYEIYINTAMTLLQGTGSAGRATNIVVTGLPTGSELHFPDIEAGSVSAATFNSFTSTATLYSPLSQQAEIITTSSTTPGTYTVHFHITTGISGVIVKDFDWDVIVDAVPTFPSGTPVSYPPIPDKALWEANMLSGGTKNCAQDGLQPRTIRATATTGICGIGAESCSWYYDGERVYYQIVDYTGDTSYNQCAANSELLYRDNYVFTNHGGVQAWRVFPQGMYMDYLRTGDANSKVGVDLLAQASPFAKETLGSLVSDRFIRESAYLIDSNRWDVHLGANQSAQMKRAVAYNLGHLDQITVSHNSLAYQPFMVGLACEALIHYYEDGHKDDVRIPTAVKTAADWMYANAWFPADALEHKGTGTFYYNSYKHSRGFDNIDQGTKSQADIREINLLTAWIYAWLFKETGDAAYQAKADEIWHNGVVHGCCNGTGKVFSQNYRMSFEFVKWREAAPVAPPPPPTGVGVQVTAGSSILGGTKVR